MYVKQNVTWNSILKLTSYSPVMLSLGCRFVTEAHRDLSFCSDYFYGKSRRVYTAADGQSSNYQAQEHNGRLVECSPHNAESMRSILVSWQSYCVWTFSKSFTHRHRPWEAAWACAPNNWEMPSAIATPCPPIFWLPTNVFDKSMPVTSLTICLRHLLK